jgi:hypothetical protein
MRKRMVIACLLIGFFPLMGMTSLSYADSAEVLPKGVSKVNVTYSYYLPIDKRFDPDGDEEDLAADFNATLDSTVFSDLELLEAAFPVLLPPGSANVGDSVVSFEYNFDDLIFSFQYGLTDKLTVGLKVPYYWNKNTVDTRLNTTNATVGKNAAIPGGLAPLAVPGTEPLTEEDVQDLLGDGLDVDGDGIVDIDGFGYKRFESWSRSGLSDIEAGARYQYLKTENWRLAFTGGVRFPTGDTDDPDNLVDVGFGSGAYALLFQFNNDYVGIENLVLNATFRYDLVLPDKETMRVPRDVNRPVTSNKEKVDRDLGDIFEFEGSGTYDLPFLEGLSFSLLYNFSFQLEDEVDGDGGFDYKSLEDETDWTSHYFIAGLSYSTIPLFKAKKFPLPLTASIEYENWFAGSNNTLKQELFSFSVTAFF